MSHEKKEEQQFKEDLKANEAASDKLDKELNEKNPPIETHQFKEVKPKPVKTEKQLILEEYGGLESNVPVNSHYWQLKI